MWKRRVAVGEEFAMQNECAVEEQVDKATIVACEYCTTLRFMVFWVYGFVFSLPNGNFSSVLFLCVRSLVFFSSFPPSECHLRAFTDQKTHKPC